MPGRQVRVRGPGREQELLQPAGQRRGSRQGGCGIPLQERLREQGDEGYGRKNRIPGVPWTRAAMSHSWSSRLTRLQKTRCQSVVRKRKRPDLRRGGREADTARYPPSIQPAGRDRRHKSDIHSFRIGQEYLQAWSSSVNSSGKRIGRSQDIFPKSTGLFQLTLRFG